MTFTSVVPDHMKPMYDQYQFSPAIRQGDLVIISGQVGIRSDFTVAETLDEQLDLVFGHLKTLMEHAGGNLSHILELNSFHVGDLGAQMGPFIAAKARHMREPHCAWTAVGVTQLALPGLFVEVRAMGRVV